MLRKIKLKAILAILLMIVSSCAPEDSSNTVTDIDGNVYTTVKIGTQVWMVENLKTTKYRNGELIGTTTPATKDLSGESTPKYQWAYNGNEGNVSKYGRLYTWYAVSDSRNIAPTGWHVPTDAEWTILEEYVAANLGTSGSEDKTLASTTDWASSTAAGTIGNDLTKNNSSGFAGLPGGYRDVISWPSSNGSFYDIGNNGYWWSSTQHDAYDAWILDLSYDGRGRYLNYSNSFVSRDYDNKQYGFSVRCVRDN